MTVDGQRNAVEEVRGRRACRWARTTPTATPSPQSRTRLTRESEAQRVADPGRGRTLARRQPGEDQPRSASPSATRCTPRASPTLLADERSVDRRRAPPSRRSTSGSPRYDADERYPAGDFVNQHAGGAGLPPGPRPTVPSTRTARTIVVLWHTFGLTHFPRPEDWPIMPVDYAGFRSSPSGSSTATPRSTSRRRRTGTATPDPAQHYWLVSLAVRAIPASNRSGVSRGGAGSPGGRRARRRRRRGRGPSAGRRSRSCR